MLPVSKERTRQNNIRRCSQLAPSGTDSERKRKYQHHSPPSK